ncbi:MAG: hypothetical protein Q7R73_03290 [bacterium]|nr:hypothetical protein [bacterium]
MSHETTAIVRQSRKEIVLEARDRILREVEGARQIQRGAERKESFQKSFAAIERWTAANVGIEKERVSSFTSDEKQALVLLMKRECRKSLCKVGFFTSAVFGGIGLLSRVHHPAHIFWILGLLLFQWFSAHVNSQVPDSPNWWTKIAFLRRIGMYTKEEDTK